MWPDEHCLQLVEVPVERYSALVDGVHPTLTSFVGLVQEQMPYGPRSVVPWQVQARCLGAQSVPVMDMWEQLQASLRCLPHVVVSCWEAAQD